MPRATPGPRAQSAPSPVLTVPSPLWEGDARGQARSRARKTSSLIGFVSYLFLRYRVRSFLTVTGLCSTLPPLSF